jgi:hypothetical protein
MRSAILVALLMAAAAGPALAQNMLDRVQGIYAPEGLIGVWDCQTVGRDGGAVAIQGNAMMGVENTCMLEDPKPVPGMDAVRYTRMCTGEGMSYVGDPVILTPTERGVGLMFDGFVTEWLRCP